MGKFNKYTVFLFVLFAIDLIGHGFRLSSSSETMGKESCPQAIGVCGEEGNKFPNNH